jgi:ubiquinone biosynthesis protein
MACATMSLFPIPERQSPPPTAQGPLQVRLLPALRACRLLGEAAALLAVHVIDRLDARRRGVPATLASLRLARAFERAGGLWLKLGQALSYRSDVIPEHFCAALSRLQGNVAAMPPVLLRAAIAHLHTNAGAAIDRLDERPIGAGCVAQVHAGYDKTGTKYAVKIRRPDAPAAMHADLSLVRLMARTARRLRLLPHMPVLQVVEALSEFMLAQLDLEQEARGNEIARQFFANDATCRIPRASIALSRREFAIFEFLDGLRPLHHPSVDRDERRRLARTCVSACFRMLFDLGMVHSDMHPGNLYLAADGRLVILDFGLVARLDPITKRLFRDFFFAFVSDNGPCCARILLETAISVPPGLDRSQFEAQVGAVVRRHANRTAKEFQCAAFVTELFKLQRRSQVVGGTVFVLAVASILTLEGVIKRLDPDCDFQQIARVTLPPIIARTAPRRPWQDEGVAWSYPDRRNQTSYVQQML